MEIYKSNGLGSMCWVKINNLSKQFIKRKKFNGVRKAVLKKIIFNFSKQDGRYMPNEEFFVKRLGVGRYSLHNKISICKLRLFHNKIQNGVIITKEEAVYLSQNRQLTVNIKCAKGFMNIMGIRNLDLQDSDFHNYTISLSPSIVENIKQEGGGRDVYGREYYGTVNHTNLDSQHYFFVPQNFQNEIRYENIPSSIYPVCDDEPAVDVLPTSPNPSNLDIPNHQQNLEVPTSTQFLPNSTGQYFFVKMETDTGESGGGNVPRYTSVQFPSNVQVPSVLFSSPSSVQVPPAFPGQFNLPPVPSSSISSAAAPPQLPVFSPSRFQVPSLLMSSPAPIPVSTAQLTTTSSAFTEQLPVSSMPSIQSTSSIPLSVFLGTPLTTTTAPSMPPVSSSMAVAHPIHHSVLSEPQAPSSKLSVPSELAKPVTPPAVPPENPILINLYDMIIKEEPEEIQDDLNLIESKFIPEDFLLGM